MAAKKKAKPAAPAKPAAKKPVSKPAANKPASKPVTKSGMATKKVMPVTAAVKKKTAKAPVAAKSKAAGSRKKHGDVLLELKTMSKELNKAANVLNVKKNHAGNPREVSTILGNVERMTSEAATKSLAEAEAAKQVVLRLTNALGRDWSRSLIEDALAEIGDHLTNIIVAQEFQDLAGQSLRQSIKALVGAIIYIDGGGPTAEGRLSQNEVDSLLNDLMP